MIYDTMTSNLGPILIARNDRGLTRVHFLDSDKPLPMDDRWHDTAEDPLIEKAKGQITRWFEGALRHFSLPLSLSGTDFQQRVWQALRTIPFGSTWSYKQLAVAVGNPAACRAVGRANGKNPLPILIP